MSGKHDRASELRAIADGRLLLNVRNGVTVSRSMLAKIADELDAERAAHAETKRERDEAMKALDFYGNRENYIEPTVEQARKTRGGDPVISHTGVGKAAPGHALSAIQLDNFGDVARAARRALEGGE